MAVASAVNAEQLALSQTTPAASVESFEPLPALPVVLLEPETPFPPVMHEPNDSQRVEPNAAAAEPSPSSAAGPLSSVIVNDPGSISDVPWKWGVNIETVRPPPGRRMRRSLLVAACVVGTLALGVTAFVTRLCAADFQRPGATAHAPYAAMARLTTTAAPTANGAPPRVDTPPETETETEAPTPAASRELQAQPPSPASASQPAAETAPDDSLPPAYVHGPTVSHRMWLALRRAERCHLDGRAIGSAEVFVTFSPEGTVSAARIEGEPLASAPVARCILEQARAIRIPKFDGDEFTLHQSIVLR